MASIASSICASTVSIEFTGEKFTAVCQGRQIVDCRSSAGLGAFGVGHLR